VDLTRLDAHRYTGRPTTWSARRAAKPAAMRYAGYVMALPVDGKVYNVDFDDWMFLMDDRVMLNRSVMSKFGFPWAKSP
jgi:hypothetical protein